MRPANFTLNTPQSPYYHNISCASASGDDLEPALNLHLCDVLEDIRASGLPPYLQADLLKRPARTQVEQGERVASSYREVDPRYNYWYHTHHRDRWEPELVEPAATRVSPSLDIGYTSASSSGSFCLWFARGACAKGAECTYLHRLPTAIDDAKLRVDKDIFGRDRFSDHRSDMGGIGSTQHECRALFVTGLVFESLAKVEAQLYRHFHTFGPIANIRLIPPSSAAVVIFQYRAAAEFARVAMHAQPIGKAKAVGVRWAVEEALDAKCREAGARREFLLKVTKALEATAP